MSSERTTYEVDTSGCFWLYVALILGAVVAVGATYGLLALALWIAS